MAYLTEFFSQGSGNVLRHLGCLTIVRHTSENTVRDNLSTLEFA